MNHQLAECGVDTCIKLLSEHGVQVTFDDLNEPNGFALNAVLLICRKQQDEIDRLTDRLLELERSCN